MRLATFQDAFATALVDGACADAAVLLADVVTQPGFAVYRNTIAKGCIDALEANYAALVRLVGAACFRAVAHEYVRRHPPSSPVLLGYGVGFADFLSNVEALHSVPYLADVARLDRFWTETHVAADAQPMSARALVGLSPEALSQHVLTLHPATRWRWCEAHPAYAIWRCNRGETQADAALPPVWCGDGALFTRCAGVVTTRAAGQGTCALLDAFSCGRSVGSAVAEALAVEPGMDFRAVMAELLSGCAFAAPMQPIGNEED
jgi:hypothetical protein